MLLLNETPFAARLLRVDLKGDGDVAAFVIVKATFERGDAGRWVVASEQLPLVEDRLDTPFGIFHTDSFSAKQGVDVCVLGSLRLARPVRSQRVSLQVGEHQSSLQVYGDRRWVRHASALEPSDPAPFSEMPISYGRAFGGVTQHDLETVAWPDNPSGLGYYLSEGEALDKPLANIEAAEAPPVKAWADQPPVAGWAPYPLFWGMRARAGIEPNPSPDGAPFPRIKASLNNHAHPSLVLPALSAEAPIRIAGLRDRELRFEAPSVRPIVSTDDGGTVSEVEGRLDGIFIWVDAERVTLTYRAAFRYAYIKGQRRQARLSNGLSAAGGRSWLA